MRPRPSGNPNLFFSQSRKQKHSLSDKNVLTLCPTACATMTVLDHLLDTDGNSVLLLDVDIAWRPFASLLFAEYTSKKTQDDIADRDEFVRWVNDKVREKIELWAKAGKGLAMPTTRTS